MLALAFERKVDHHDAVLLHDTDQQNDADNRHHAQILAKNNQREKSAHARRRERRQNRNRMDEALIQNPKHNVDGDQRRQNQQRLIGQRIRK